MMSDYERQRDDELMAIPRLAERVGVTPRVLRYWEEQQLISPTREHGKLRYSPRDLAIAALIRRLLEAGVGVEGIRMLKRLAERDVRHAAGDEAALAEEALRILYQRKAFREETGMDEEHYPQGKPPPPPPPPHAPKPGHGPRPPRPPRPA
jgi:DNA-binding transcriptional MerR regulator